MSLRSIALNNPFSAGQYFDRNHTAGNRQKFTISFWTKPTSIFLDAFLMFSGLRIDIDEPTEGQRFFRVKHSSSSPSWEFIEAEQFGVNSKIIGNRYNHILVAVDTTQVDPADRVKIYVNAVQLTSFQVYDPPTQNYFVLNSSGTWKIGSDDRVNMYYRGLFDEIYFIDGYQLTPSDFCTAAPGGPKQYTGAFGNQGFYLDFEDNSSVAAMLADKSNHGFNWIQRGNNFTTANSSTDVPADALFTDNFEIAAPTIGAGTGFFTGWPAGHITVASPQFSTPIFDPQFPGELRVSGPVIGQPLFHQIGKNVLDAATPIIVGPPVLAAGNMFDFGPAALGSGWTVSAGGGQVGGPFAGSRQEFDAIVLMDTPSTGPYEISRSVIVKDTPDIYRLSFDVCPIDRGNYVQIGITDDDQLDVGAIFNIETGHCMQRISTGPLPTHPEFKLLGVEADPLLLDYYRLVVIAQKGSETYLRGYIRLVDDNLDPTYVGSSLRAALVCHPFLFEGVDLRTFRWEIGPPEMRFFWTANTSEVGLLWFRAGQGELGVDPHLQFLTDQDLFCVFQRWQPAQDQLVFDYSNLAPGTTDPMAGTP